MLDRLHDARPEATTPSRTPRRRVFAGLTWEGVALLALLCLLNAMRRMAERFFEALDTGVGAVSTWLADFGETFGMGLMVLLLMALAMLATYNLAPSAPRVRHPALALAIVISSGIGTVILAAIEPHGALEYLNEGGQLWHWIVSTWARNATLGLLVAAVFTYFRTAEVSEAATHQAKVDSARLAQQMDEARLQVLQAQIEPHFLFNTLANVRRLYQTEPAAAESMLENLMRYLAVALPQMRTAESTLGREVALTESYLNIQRIRMGRRLAFDIDVPQSLRDARVPPMMLLTLAENAIRHGLNPQPEGGRVRISARVEGRQLRLQVADTGMGFTKTSGPGIGLANTRARLAAMYGERGQLSIGLNRPRGLTATIDLPYTTALPATAAT